MSSATPYTMPLPPDEQPPKRGNGVGLAALIVGVVALVTAIAGLVLPVLLVIAFLAALAAVVLGIVGLVLRGRRRATALTGLILGGVSLIAAIVVSVVLIVALATTVSSGIGSLSSAFPSAFPSGLPTDLPTDLPTELGTAGPSLPAGNHTITYTVTGGGSATVSYSAYAGGAFGSRQARKVALPFIQKQSFTSTAGQPGTYTLVASQTSASGKLSCSISVDGTVISTKSTSGDSFSFIACIGRTG